MRTKISRGSAVPKIPAPAWLQTGLVMAGGWEPSVYLIRHGAGGSDFLSGYLEQYSTASLKKLKAAGVNFFLLNFFKGAGLNAEKQDMERAIRTSKTAHKMGFRVGFYIGDTILFESFLTENSGAESWTQIAADGRPVWYSEGQTFRRRWCRNNPAYFIFMKKLIRMAIERGDADLVHMDNFFHLPEPEGCHCTICRKEFRRFIETRYSPAQRVKRFGFESVDNIIPPEYGRHEGPSNLDIIRNPLLQEWCDFRAFTNSLVYGRLASYAHGLKPDVAFECNPGGIWGHNNAWQRAVDHETLLRSGEAFWNEEFLHPGVNEEGVVASRVRSMKVARKMDQAMFIYTFNGDTERQTELMLSESLAFNQGNLGYVSSMAGETLDTPVIRRYIRFLKEHSGLYQGTTSCARLAVVRSYASLAYNSIDTHLAVLAMEQLLLEARIPFDIIFESHLPEARKKYATLVLADAESMSDASVEHVRAFVASGGNLFATGSTSLYNEHRRRRSDFGLADVFGISCPKGDIRGPMRTMRNFGEGRAVYLPEITIITERKMGNKNWSWGYPICSPWMHPKYWSLPGNAVEILDALRWLQQDEWLCRVNASHGVLAEYLSRPAADRVFVHLVNYALEKNPGAVMIELQRKAFPGICRAWAVSPNRQGRTDLDIVVSKESFGVSLDADSAYTIVCFATKGVRDDH